MAKATGSDRKTAKALLSAEGRTYAQDAGIRLRDTPQPLYQVLVMACLLSARIKASVAIDSARALFEHGMRSPRGMRDATWQQRVDALGEGHYRRYDERTATQLGEGAQLVLDAWGGDLRRVREEADGDPDRLREELRRVPGLGPVGADIFLREVQSLWPEVGPLFDGKAVQGAKRLGLPEQPEKLAGLVARDERAVFAAALVRAALDKGVVDEVREVAA
ncbi:endonuclease [Streptomyces sp. ICBB 8177]|uniref:endonuclease n=1 Tax=Streptomyces sp. ICBB 8177 TaxID=563922 RepID=UPI000D67A880|nr:endonuclease [Streptomyces sp. ICBB 8177]PWI42825.1 endonuclease [Streptomyces sp. ICBB 8177]